jgi:hypothetical protein
MQNQGLSLVRDASARFHGWASLHDMVCPRGHHIRQDALVLDHGAIRCTCRDPLNTGDATGRARHAAGFGPECGTWLYVIGSLTWNVHIDENGTEHIEVGDSVYVAEVTRAELTQIRAQRMSVDRVVAFLGLPRYTSTGRNGRKLGDK